MSNLPIDKQLCTKDQARQLSELLGEHAPGSFWVWESYTWICDGKERTEVKLRKSVEIRAPSAEYYSAYTGDELGVLLPLTITYLDCEEEYQEDKFWNRESKKIEFMCGYEFEECTKSSTIEAQAKAELAIKILTEKWIKPEDFRYENA